MPQIGSTEGEWLAKFIGAMAGSAISLAYVLPREKREAAIRFLVGVTSGLVFGMPVGVWLIDHFELQEKLQKFEIALMGAGFASLMIWTALGFAQRIVEVSALSIIRARISANKSKSENDE